MAWVNTQQGRSGRVLDSTQEPGAGNTIETIRRIYSVLFDSASDGMAAALTASGVPAIGDADAALSQCTCYKKTVQEKTPFLFEVAADFAGRESVLLAPYERAWDFASAIEEATEDASGAALVNPVGDRYSGIMRETGDYVYVVTRNEATFPVALARQYAKAVSNDAYQGFLAGEARMVGGITGRRVVDGASYYWRVTYRIQFREGGWLVRRRIDGMYQLSAVARIRCLDDQGREVIQPVPLDAAGAQLATGDPDEFQTFQLYNSLSFVALGLG